MEYGQPRRPVFPEAHHPGPRPADPPVLSLWKDHKAGLGLWAEGVPGARAGDFSALEQNV